MGPLKRIYDLRSLLAKLPLPGDNEITIRSSSRCHLPPSLPRQGEASHYSFNAERQAGKL